MREAETIVVGGGPAGSACAGELLRNGRDCLVLEMKSMPRPKLCAGWISPKVFADLGIAPDDYPHGLTPLEKIRIFLGRRLRRSVTLGGRQWSVRRVEFDAWLLQRSGAEVVEHKVRHIRRDAPGFVLDDAFHCRRLVGAGGTACPVRRLFFPKRNGRLIVTREVEFPGECRRECTLWLPFAGRDGYAWCVPKRGAVNVGFGLPHEQLAGQSLSALWARFVGLLKESGCLEADPPAPRGHPYYMGGDREPVQRDGAYLVGDAAGLATLDLAEGIGPAIESGLLAARDILGQETYSAAKIAPYSLRPLGCLAKRLATLMP